jgi:transposase
MYLGIDLHKSSAQVAVMNEAGEIEAERRVSTDKLGEIAEEYAGSEAVIEATSNYYHVYEVLSEHLDVQVANPNKLQTIATSDKKTDRVDAKQLARLLRLDSVPESYVPSEQIRECRALVRGRTKLVQVRTEMVNKIHGLLTDQGITEAIKPLSVEGREVLADLSLPTPWEELLESYLEIIDTLSEEIDRLDDLIEEIADERDETQLLMTIPGVSHYSALLLYAEIGDVDRFDTAKQVVSYVGLNPVVRESGDSRFEGSISKRGPGIVRWQLVQSSYVAVHNCRDEYLSRFYDRLNGRKDSKVAIVATARKMLVSIYHMLDRQEVYDPPGVSS